MKGEIEIPFLQFKFEISEQGNLLVTRDIYDQDRQLVAKLEKNFWRVANYSPWFERPDAHTLKVYNSSGEEALSVYYANPKTMLVGGTFYWSDNNFDFKEVAIDGELNLIGKAKDKPGKAEMVIYGACHYVTIDESGKAKVEIFAESKTRAEEKTTK